MKKKFFVLGFFWSVSLCAEVIYSRPQATYYYGPAYVPGQPSYYPQIVPQYGVQPSYYPQASNGITTYVYPSRSIPVERIRPSRSSSFRAQFIANMEKWKMGKQAEVAQLLKDWNGWALRKERIRDEWFKAELSRLDALVVSARVKQDLTAKITSGKTESQKAIEDIRLAIERQHEAWYKEIDVWEKIYYRTFSREDGRIESADDEVRKRIARTEAEKSQFKTKSEDAWGQVFKKFEAYSLKNLIKVTRDNAGAFVLFADSPKYTAALDDSLAYVLRYQGLSETKVLGVFGNKFEASSLLSVDGTSDSLAFLSSSFVVEGHQKPGIQLYVFEGAELKGVFESEENLEFTRVQNDGRGGWYVWVRYPGVATLPPYFFHWTPETGELIPEELTRMAPPGMPPPIRLP